MTLIELLVGLTIAGLVLGAGYGAFGQIADARERARSTIDRATGAAAAREALATWLAGARLTIEGDATFRGVDGVRDGTDDTPDDELTFLTTSPTPLGAAQTVVRLFIDREPATPERGLVAELSSWHGAARELLEIVPDAAALDTRYLSGVLGTRQWLPSWISTSLLPAGVELRLAGTAAEPLHPLWQTPLVAPLGGGR